MPTDTQPLMLGDWLGIWLGIPGKASSFYLRRFMALREGLGPPPPQQTFVRWNDPYGTELIGFNRDGTIYSFGLIFPDGTSQRSSAGPTVQNNVTTSRSLGSSVYQNTTGKPLYVYVTAIDSLSGGTLALRSDSQNPPLTNLDIFNSEGFGAYGGVFCIVLPGNYYQAFLGSAGNAWTLETWVEQY